MGGASRIRIKRGLRLIIFKLSDFSIIIAKYLNVIFKGNRTTSIFVSLVKGCYLYTIVNIIPKII